MKSDFALRSGSMLTRTPSLRQESGRRRLLVVCAVLAGALISGVIGSLTPHIGDAGGKAALGPFSYFPRQ
jgi:hypothetical protein